MASATAHLPPRAATGARVGRTRSGSANEPTRLHRDTRAELRSHLDRVIEKAPELAQRHLAGQWAIRYLESSRVLGPPPAPMSPADQVRISYAQADLVVHLTTAVLEGIGVTDEVWQQGCDIAMNALKTAAEEGWSPL